jgi:hypothetical protein
MLIEELLVQLVLTALEFPIDACADKQSDPAPATAK